MSDLCWLGAQTEDRNLAADIILGLAGIKGLAARLSWEIGDCALCYRLKAYWP